MNFFRVATKGSNFSVDADDNACRVCKLVSSTISIAMLTNLVYPAIEL